MYESMKQFLRSAFRSAVTVALICVVGGIGFRASAYTVDTIWNTVFDAGASALKVTVVGPAGAADGQLAAASACTAVTVANTQTLLEDAAQANTAARFFRFCLNADATQTVYVGGTGVTSSTGTPVFPGGCFDSGDYRLPADVATPYFGIVSAGTQVGRACEDR